MLATRAVAQPRAEPMHHVRNVTGQRGREAEVAVRIADPVLTHAVLAGTEHRIDVVEHPAMDLADDPLVDPERRIGREVVDERERGARGQDLQRVLLRGRRQALKHLLDLEVVQAVPLDPGRAVDGANPRPMAEPVPIARVETQVGEEPLDHTWSVRT